MPATNTIHIDPPGVITSIPRTSSGHKRTETPFLDIAALSDIGKVRDENEDSFLTADLKRELTLGPSSLPLCEGACLVKDVQAKVLAVADGVSGNGGGGVASSVAMNAIARYLATAMPWIAEIGEDDEQLLAEELEAAFQRCQKRLRAEAVRHGYLDRSLATTMTVGYIAWPQFFIAHAGDSRCYLYRDERLHRLTTDDTLAQQMLDHAIIPPARSDKVPFTNILVNAIGGEKDELSIEFHRVPLVRGDRILLCTDGITHHLSDSEIALTLGAGVTSEMCCRRLIDLANSRGGQDNMTAVVASVQ